MGAPRDWNAGARRPQAASARASLIIAVVEFPNETKLWNPPRLAGNVDRSEAGSRLRLSIAAPVAARAPRSPSPRDGKAWNHVATRCLAGTSRREDRGRCASPQSSRRVTCWSAVIYVAVFSKRRFQTRPPPRRGRSGLRAFHSLHPTATPKLSSLTSAFNLNPA